MIKRTTKHGNSQALVLGKDLLEILEITPETDLKITTDGRSLLVTPVGQEHDGESAFERSMKRVHEQHKATFEGLANR
jgi:antitoxin component of MazEF toxin-antitoxin module